MQNIKDTLKEFSKQKAFAITLPAEIGIGTCFNRFFILYEKSNNSVSVHFNNIELYVYDSIKDTVIENEKYISVEEDILKHLNFLLTKNRSFLNDFEFETKQSISNLKHDGKYQKIKSYVHFFLMLFKPVDRVKNDN